MARSKRDDMKRNIAQAVNHQAQSILDVNNVYVQFEEAGKPEAETLKQVMIHSAQLREVLLAFALQAWQIDEDRLMNWI